MSQLKVNTIRHTGATSDAITLASDGSATANITNIVGNRNMVINGAMAINQRGDTSSVTTTGYRSCDRWVTGLNSCGTWTISQATGPTDKGFNKCIKYDCTTAHTATGTQFVQLNHRFEGNTTNRLAWGTSGAKKAVVSFWAKAEINGWSSGTKSFVVEIQTSSSHENGNLCTLTTNNTWQKFTIPIEAFTTSTITTTNAESAGLIFWLDAGSDYTSGTLASGWGNGANANRAAGLNLGLAAHTDNNFYLTGVQFEVDEKGDGLGTEFEHLHYNDDLDNCLRYYQAFTAEFRMDNSADGVISYHTLGLPVKMRTSPTITSSYASSYNVNTGASLEDAFIDPQAICFGHRASGAGTRARRDITLSAEL